MEQAMELRWGKYDPWSSDGVAVALTDDMLDGSALGYDPTSCLCRLCLTPAYTLTLKSIFFWSGSGKHGIV
jgi:hypothetical protein